MGDIMNHEFENAIVMMEYENPHIVFSEQYKKTHQYNDAVFFEFFKRCYVIAGCFKQALADNVEFRMDYDVYCNVSNSDIRIIQKQHRGSNITKGFINIEDLQVKLKQLYIDVEMLSNKEKINFCKKQIAPIEGVLELYEDLTPKTIVKKSSMSI